MHLAALRTQNPGQPSALEIRVAGRPRTWQFTRESIGNTVESVIPLQLYTLPTSRSRAPPTKTFLGPGGVGVCCGFYSSV